MHGICIHETNSVDATWSKEVKRIFGRKIRNEETGNKTNDNVLDYIPGSSNQKSVSDLLSQSVFSSEISIKSSNKHKAARKIFVMDCLPEICCCNYYFYFFFYFYRKKPENEIVRNFVGLSFDSISMDDSLSLFVPSAEYMHGSNFSCGLL